MEKYCVPSQLKIMFIVPNEFLLVGVFHNSSSGVNEVTNPSNNSINNINEEKTKIGRFLGNISLGVSEVNNFTFVEQCKKAFLKSSLAERKQISSQVCKKLLEWSNPNLDIVHAYLKLCNKNFIPLNYRLFLASLHLDPHVETYKLLFENVCEHGSLEEALTLLELMKTKQVPIVEDIFNNLVLVHTISGGIPMAESVLVTMRAAHISETNATILAIYRGLLKRCSYADFKTAVLKYPVRLKVEEFLLLVEYLALCDNDSLLTEIEHLYKHIDFTRVLENELEDLCVRLIYMNRPRSAMLIYKRFISQKSTGHYGETLLQEMLVSNSNASVVIALAKNLREENLNDFVLENLTEFCLRRGLEKQAWALLETLNLKCHYFWPLLVMAGQSSGEIGVFSVLKKMNNFKVKPDLETFEDYVFPFCDLGNVDSLIATLKTENISVRELLSPLMIYLLKRNRIKKASYLCSKYGTSSFALEILDLLPVVWNNASDDESVANILQKYYETNRVDSDIVGNFLVSSLKTCKRTEDFTKFSRLIKVMASKPWKISFASADEVVQLLQCVDEKIQTTIRNDINTLLDITMNCNDQHTSIPHPRNMGLHDLECHLVELREKNMDTRGVLRKLIHFHARQGNLKRMAELRRQFLDAGYVESPGIKSLVMHSFVLAGNLEEALTLYNDIKVAHPDFAFDSFKCIDMAQLLVEHGRFDEAMGLLQNEVEKFQRVDSRETVRNCLRLLNSCKVENEQTAMFDFLLKANLCKGTNVLLGPLVRIHLNKGNLDKAVERYVELSTKYKCTPLQRELISALARTENFDLLEKVMSITEKVHGGAAAHVGLIAALAENGQMKPLRKALIETRTGIRHLLEKQCVRWVQERRVEPLLALSKIRDRFPGHVFNVDFVYGCVIDVYGLNNDGHAALSFFESISEEHLVKPNLQRMLVRTLKKCNYEIPENLKIKNHN
ncbi:leucine-rich PPR motif-containing protein, mitochondrial [Cylas formicarius]|uniref:leucine-rich PPR motif-containing protein, mitochondrial n=1 Tax=Cylas formicarius TaxID=197179 RepID=UPI002958D7AC|nr:leucine-rich PPR motif-containing protein, mitochondrial [Cylas formicarius]